MSQIFSQIFRQHKLNTSWVVQENIWVPLQMHPFNEQEGSQNTDSITDCNWTQDLAIQL